MFRSVPTVFDNPFTVMREIEKLKAWLRKLQSQVDNLPVEQNLTQRVEILETKVAQLENDVEVLDPETIQGQLDVINNSITEVQTSMSQLQTDVTELTNNFNTFKTNTTSALQTLTTVAEKHEQDIGELDSKVAALETGKQDKLTFDDTPTEGSSNPVTSDGIAKAIAAGEGGGGTIILDDEVTATSTNGVKSSGIYTAIQQATNPLIVADNLHTTEIATLKQQAEEAETQLSLLDDLVAGKQDVLTFDNTPTLNSNNPVTSDGIARAIAAGGGSIILDDTVTADSENGVKSSGIYTAIENAVADKQDKLTFDDTPTEGSNNPVTSDGIAKAIAAGGGGGDLTNYYTKSQTVRKIREITIATNAVFIPPSNIGGSTFQSISYPSVTDKVVAIIQCFVIVPTDDGKIVCPIPKPFQSSSPGEKYYFGVGAYEITINFYEFNSLRVNVASIKKNGAELTTYPRCEFRRQYIAIPNKD